LKVFLTGALGYIGSAINHILIQNGFSVVGLDAGLFTEDCFYRQDIWNSRTLMQKLIRKDVRDISEDDLRSCDAVVDFAGLANDPSGELNPTWTDEINHQASVRLAQLSRKQEISRYIFASSCSVYGARGDTLVTEDSPVEPVSAYAKAKVAAEHEILPLANKLFHPTILRNATAYGASPRMRFDLVVNNLTAYGYTTGVVKILSDGTAWRPNVHIEDIALAVKACLESPSEDAGGTILNVGANSENYQVRTIASIITETITGSKVEIAKGASKDPRSYRVSFDKITKLKSFTHRWNVRRGVEELRDAFQKNDFTFEKFQNLEFHNVRKIQALLESGKLDATLRLSQP
jgi:nucleoside-diphosphate-sugar epimerase